MPWTNTSARPARSKLHTEVNRISIKAVEALLRVCSFFPVLFVHVFSYVFFHLPVLEHMPWFCDVGHEGEAPSHVHCHCGGWHLSGWAMHERFPRQGEARGAFDDWKMSYHLYPLLPMPATGLFLSLLVHAEWQSEQHHQKLLGSAEEALRHTSFATRPFLTSHGCRHRNKPARG